MTAGRLSVDTPRGGDAAAGRTAVDAALDRTAARYRALAGQERLLDADVLELALLSANAAHLLTYLEGNQRHLGPVTALRRRWERLLADPPADAAALTLLERTACERPVAEQARQDLLALLRGRAGQRSAAAAVDSGYAQAREVLDSVEEARAALLARVGLRAGGAAPAAVYYRAVSTASPATRGKLVHAWEAQRARHTAPLLDRLDEVVRIRRARVRDEGTASVLDRTLRRSTLDEGRAAAFVDAYLKRAVATTGRLATRIRTATGATDHPLDHFGAYARTVVGDAVLPDFPLDGCLDYLAAITRDVFGIVLTPQPSARADEHVVLGTRDGQPVGVATFDLRGADPAEPRHERDPADLPEPAPTLPAARVLCRYRLDSRGRRVVSFDGVHSILHEFGHVLNHWLLRRHTPSDTGLDYLPLERIEDLSTWFEKWAYHPRFASHLALSAADEAGLAVCARVKRLEFLAANLDRAVVAALDLDLHRRDSGGVEESFRRIEARFELGGLCRLPTVAGYLLWPLCRAYPGANLAYLWGAAFGAQAIAPWSGPGPAPADVAAVLGSCLDPDAPSREPGLDPLFLFYDTDG
jgi:oligopeptidase A